MHYVYILKRKKDEFYIGQTNDLVRRLEEHKNKYNCELVYYEAFKTEELSRERERKLKNYGSAWRALKKRLT